MSKISELSDGGSLQSTDYLIAVRSGGNVKVRPNGAVSGTTGQFSTSLNVDGTVTADGLTVDAGGTLRLDSSSSTDFFTIIQGGTQAVLIADSPDGAGNMLFRTAAAGVDLDRMQIASGGDISFYDSAGSSQSFFWDASAERLGIGTTTPGGPLEVTVASGTSGSASGFRLISADGGGYAVYPTSAVANPVWNTNVNSGEQFSWSTGGNERIRIDSLGNLLVGTTSEATWTTTAGFRTRPSGSTTITRSAAPVLYANRLTSDGAIQEFLKDGTTVGSIGNFDANNMYIGSGDTGIAFQGTADRLLPIDASTGAVRNSAIDLGYSAGRFKDLYLSGGVYLGGTGAANLLDDYEEGTFTATLRDATSGGNTSSSTTTGTYTKVGRLVTCSFNSSLNNIDTTGMTGANTLFMDLPFASNTGCEDVGILVYDNLDTGSINASITNVAPDGVSGAATVCQFRAYGDNMSDVALKVQDITSGTTDFVRFTLTYQTP